MPSIAYLKDQFQAMIAPGNDQEFLRIVNEADQRLLESGRWWWCKARSELTAVDGYVYLPSDYASILGFQFNGHPIDIRSEEYEFMPDGVGNLPMSCGGSALIDAGLDEVTGQRHYKVGGGINDRTVLYALLLYAPVLLYDPAIPPVPLPPDAVSVTRCPHVAALKLMCFAINYEENHDIDAATGYAQRAAAVLEDNAQNVRGAAKPTLIVRPYGPGVSKIRNIR